MTVHVWGPLFKFSYLSFEFITTDSCLKTNRERRALPYIPLLFQMYSCHVKVASHSELKHYEIKISLEKLCGAYVAVQVLFHIGNLSMCE